MFKQIGPFEITLIILLVVLLFGAKKLPDLARGVGRSLRIFKSETKGLVEDEAAAGTAAAPQAAARTEALPPAPSQPTAGSPAAPVGTERTDA